VERFLRSAPDAKTILELGALEGAHSFILARQPRVERVVALEGRERNLRKARFVQDLLGIRNLEFAQANLEDADLAQFGKFDAVFCCGLLYHLPEPWKLIERLPAVAPSLFIWTQYAAENEARDLGNGWRGKIHIEGGPDEPLSGLSGTATWLTLQSLRDVLAASGYQTIEVLCDDPAHANGPAVTLFARSG
ncbi:MAG TPA: class I SAM-dependent methyltransferase, partial [Chthoniobacterales bacterium]